MSDLTLFHRLVEQHDYHALHEACIGAGPDEPDLQVLRALAEVRLGDLAAGRCTLATIDCNTLSLGARVDLAAVRIALGELEQAIALLKAAQPRSGARSTPAHALALARLAWCRLQQGRREAAMALYERSLAIRPMLAAYLNLLRLYRDSDRREAMTQRLDAAWRFWALEQTHWPDHQRDAHSQRLRGLQLDLWLAQDQLETAEAWIERQRRALPEADWCALLTDWAERLAKRDRHPQAEEWLRQGLQCYPENKVLHAQLAELAQVQGRPAQAIALLQRAIALAGKSNAPTYALLIQLSTVALQSRLPLSRTAAQQALAELEALEPPAASNADEIAEARWLATVALADVERREKNYAAAERRYQEVLDARPHLVAALQGLGQLHMQLGDIDQAVTLFEQVTALDPGRGYSALINARHFPEDDATLERLERLARTPDLEGTVRSGLLFQLAAAWEQRGDYDKAFASADAANAASRRLLRYDSAAHRQRCARIRHAFPRALYDHRPDTGLQTSVPVFVVGMPRSGTSLVEQMLAAHSRIHGAGELGTIPRVIAGLERWERHTGSGRRYPDCVDDLDPTVTRGIAERVLAEMQAFEAQADHIVDKLPHNFEHIGLIRLLFPQAKIISVRRDPRDIAVSNYFTDFAAKHSGMGFAYDLDWIGEQLADHNLLMHHWQQLFPDNMLELAYEDLVDDPVTAARRMLDYIGVRWEPAVLEFHTVERPVQTASVWQVRQPLYASAKGRWRRYQQHLQPLIAACNRKIVWDPVEMATLPEPGWLNQGVDRFRQGDLDAAEYRFKQLLHHLPHHAAARFMLGLVYVRKSDLTDGIALMEQAVEACPWQQQWRHDLLQAYRMDGREADAAALKERMAAVPGGEAQQASATPPIEDASPDTLDYLFTSEGATCAHTAAKSSGARG